MKMDSQQLIYIYIYTHREKTERSIWNFVREPFPKRKTKVLTDFKRNCVGFGSFSNSCYFHKIIFTSSEPFLKTFFGIECND